MLIINKKIVVGKKTLENSKCCEYDKISMYI